MIFTVLGRRLERTADGEATIFVAKLPDGAEEEYDLDVDAGAIELAPGHTANQVEYRIPYRAPDAAGNTVQREFFGEGFLFRFVDGYEVMGYYLEPNGNGRGTLHIVVHGDAAYCVQSSTWNHQTRTYDLQPEIMKTRLRTIIDGTRPLRGDPTPLKPATPLRNAMTASSAPLPERVEREQQAQREPAQPAELQPALPGLVQPMPEQQPVPANADLADAEESKGASQEKRLALGTDRNEPGDLGQTTIDHFPRAAQRQDEQGDSTEPLEFDDELTHVRDTKDSD